MKQLEHNDPTYPDRTAHAPYNFVQLPATVAKPADPPANQDRYYLGGSDGARHTGYMECTLTAASPLYTRCGVSLERIVAELDKEDGPQAKDLPDFLTNPATQEPMIAGSSIRGMLRTLVEIVGHGKMPDVTDKQLFFRTMDTSKVSETYRRRFNKGLRGGIFRQNGDNYYIQPCIVGRVPHHNFDTNDGTGYLFEQKVLTGSGPQRHPNWEYQYRSVQVKLANNSQEDLSNFRKIKGIHIEDKGTWPHEIQIDGTWQDGILVISGAAPFNPRKPDKRKRSDFVFVRTSGPNIQISEMQYRQFHDDDQITKWQKDAFPQTITEGTSRLRDGYLADGEPIFYLCAEEGKIDFFGRAAHFRLPYMKSPKKMLPFDLQSRKLDDLDIAEAIFGYVDLEDAKGKTRARGGRIFVSDAHLMGEPSIALYDSPITPQILSSPKPTSIQHYLNQKYSDQEKQLFHYDSDPQNETNLRGHKLYWHQGNVSLKQIQADQKDVKNHDTQYTSIRPVKAGSSFSFKIHFDNLSDIELGILLWILELGKDPKYRLKLGMGKPLGMGSIRIDHELTLTNRQARYQHLFDKNGQWENGLYKPDVINNMAQHAKDEFGKWLLRSNGLEEEQNGSSASDRLLELPRIRTLLLLLTWNSADPNKLEYMPLKGFRYRPVLPRAEVVAGLESPRRDSGGQGGGGQGGGGRGGGGNRGQGQRERGNERRNQPQDQGPRRRVVHQDKPEQPRSDSNISGDVWDFLNRKKDK